MRIVEPGVGFLACGYEGARAGSRTPTVIVAEIERAVGRRDLAGERVLVTAGPNREAIDPVRFISNRSTGKDGLCAGRRRLAARRRGDVGRAGRPRCRRRTACAARRRRRRRRCARRCSRECEAASMSVMAAAVADYRPARPAAQKIKKGRGALTLELERNGRHPRRAARGARASASAGRLRRRDRRTCVANAERKLRDKELDLIVANDVSRADAGFAVDTNAVALHRRRRSAATICRWPSKDEVAERDPRPRRRAVRGAATVAEFARARAARPSGAAVLRAKPRRGR